MNRCRNSVLHASASGRSAALIEHQGCHAFRPSTLGHDIHWRCRTIGRRFSEPNIDVPCVDTCALRPAAKLEQTVQHDCEANQGCREARVCPESGVCTRVPRLLHGQDARHLRSIPVQSHGPVECRRPTNRVASGSLSMSLTSAAMLHLHAGQAAGESFISRIVVKLMQTKWGVGLKQLYQIGTID